MSARRPRGEALALVLKALRENPAGLAAKEVAAATGIELVLCGVLLSQYRGAGHIEAFGPRPQRWRIASSPTAPARPVNVAGSIFDARPGTRALLASPGSSRVIVAGECCVAPDDFTSGAFMRDWQARRAGACK